MAQNIIFPEYKDNFKVSNVNDVYFEESYFDIIIFDPELFSDDDLLNEYIRFYSYLKKWGKFIILFTQDWYNRMKDNRYFISMYQKMKYERLDGIYYKIIS